MPKKDPMTGCQVMTLEEFAASEETTVSELLTPMFEEFDRESKEREDAIRRDPIAFFLDALHAYPVDEEPPPFVSGEVISASVSYGYSKSSERATMRLLDARGAPWTVEVAFMRWDGGRWEPPDEDIQIDWKEAVR